MKKLLCMILCLMLLIPAAFAAQGDVTISSVSGQLDQYGISGNFNSYCAIGDTLYLVTYDGKIVAHTVGEAEPKVYSSEIGNSASDENTYSNWYLFSANGKLYALRCVTRYNSETRNPESYSANLNEITFSGDQAVANPLFDVDVSQLCSSEGYLPYFQSILGVGDYLMIYSDDGSSTAGVWCMSLSDGSMKRVDVATSGNYLMNLVAYTNGTALTEAWTDNGQSVNFYSIDPAAGTSTQISSIPVDNYDSFNNVAVDTATGTVYCVKGGEIHTLDLMTGTLSEGITDVASDSGNCGYILDGGFFAIADYQSYSLRNINPGQQSERKMKISSQSWGGSVDAAYYTFANAHGDVSVVYSHEYSDVENLIQDMMNRDSTTDVYILNGSGTVFSAIYQRGYLADFTASEKLMQFASTIQPEFLEQLSVNGKFSVLPLNGYFYLPFVNRKAMEKAGISAEEIPTNWADFINWLPTLADRLPSGMSVFDPWTSDKQARSSLFYAIFQCYQNYLQQDPNSVNANDVTAILEALDRVDFNALGQPTEEQTSSDNYNPDWNEDSVLVELNSGRTLSGLATQYYPLVMSLKSGLPSILTMDVTVAVINPFSKNTDLAIEFLETLVDKMDEEMAYTICTDKTEPVPNSWYDENMKGMQEYIDQLNDQLAKAADVDKQELETALQQAQKSMESMQQNDRYSISDKDIDWISAHRADLRISGNDWLYSDDGGDAYSLIQQYMDGQIDASRLMKEIDRKVRMRIMEGA